MDPLVKSNTPRYTTFLALIMVIGCTIVPCLADADLDSVEKYGGWEVPTIITLAIAGAIILLIGLTLVLQWQHRQELRDIKSSIRRLHEASTEVIQIQHRLRDEITGSSRTDFQTLESRIWAKLQLLLQSLPLISKQVPNEEETKSSHTETAANTRNQLTGSGAELAATVASNSQNTPLTSESVRSDPFKELVDFYNRQYEVEQNKVSSVSNDFRLRYHPERVRVIQSTTSANAQDAAPIRLARAQDGDLLIVNLESAGSEILLIPRFELSYTPDAHFSSGFGKLFRSNFPERDAGAQRFRTVRLNTPAKVVQRGENHFELQAKGELELSA